MTQYYTATVNDKLQVGKLDGIYFYFHEGDCDGEYEHIKKLTDLTPVKFVLQDAVVLEGVTSEELIDAIDHAVFSYDAGGAFRQRAGDRVDVVSKVKAQLIPPKPRPSEPKTYGSVIKAVGERCYIKEVWIKDTYLWTNGATWRNWIDLSDIEILFVAPEGGE